MNFLEYSQIVLKEQRIFETPILFYTKSKSLGQNLAPTLPIPPLQHSPLTLPVILSRHHNIHAEETQFHLNFITTFITFAEFFFSFPMRLIFQLTSFSSTIFYIISLFLFFQHEIMYNLFAKEMSMAMDDEKLSKFIKKNKKER